MEYGYSIRIMTGHEHPFEAYFEGFIACRKVGKYWQDEQGYLYKRFNLDGHIYFICEEETLD